MQRRYSIYLMVPMFLFAAATAGGMTACGKSSGSSGSKKKSGSVTIGAGAAGTVAISAGSVDIPANTLEEGSTVTLKKTAQPESFSVVESSEASSAVSLSVKDASGKDVENLSSPVSMTIKISAEAASLALATGYENLCALAFTASDELFVWRNALLEVDAAKKTATFDTKKTGTFQLFYCGADKLTGFTEAASSGATGALDGTWLLTSMVCNGTPMEIQAGLNMTMRLSGTRLATSYVETGCNISQDQVVAFPGAGQITYVSSADGVCSAAANGSCAPDQCPTASAEPDTATFSSTETTWTFTESVPECSPGSLVSTYTRQ